MMETSSVVLVTLVVAIKVMKTILSRVVSVMILVTGGFLPQTDQQTFGMSGQDPWVAQDLLLQSQTKPSGQGWQTVLSPLHWRNLGWGFRGKVISIQGKENLIELKAMVAIVDRNESGGSGLVVDWGGNRLIVDGNETDGMNGRWE